MKIVDIAAAFLLATIGVGFLDMGLEIRSDQGPYAGGVTTTATTTSFRTERSVDRRHQIGTNCYRPVYTFRTTTGETMTYDDPIVVIKPPRLGRTVELSYRVNDPAKARVVRGWHGWTGYPIVFASVGVLGLGFVVYVYGRFLIWAHAAAGRRARLKR